MVQQPKPAHPTPTQQEGSLGVDDVAQVLAQLEGGRRSRVPISTDQPNVADISSSAAAGLPVREEGGHRGSASLASAAAVTAPTHASVAASPAATPQQVVPLRSVFAFVGVALLCIVLFTLAWSRWGGWLALPSAQLSAWALEWGAHAWVQSVDVGAELMTVHSSLRISSAETGWRPSEIILDINPGRYGYSLAILLALFLAAHAPGWPKRLLVGALVLVPFQAFSTVTQSLMQLCLATDLNLALLGLKQLQLELLIYAYQFGSLVVPPLSPLLIWLWLDWDFVRRRFIAFAPQAKA